MNTARKYCKETVSVSSDDSESWGGVESLNVPETKSTAEKKAEEEAKKAEEERKAAEKAAAEAARLQAAEVSRSRASAATSSTSSSSVSNDGAVNAPVSANGAGVVAYASQFQGVPYVYAYHAVGIRLLGLHAVRVLQVRHQPAAYRLSAACVGSGSRHEGQRSPAGRPDVEIRPCGHLRRQRSDDSRAAPRQERVHRARIRFLQYYESSKPVASGRRVFERSSHCTAPPLGRCRAFSTGDAATMPCPLPLRCRAL